MATKLQIFCVTSTPGKEPHERISHAGGVISAQRWQLTQDEIITLIEKNMNTFFVTRGGVMHDVIVYSNGNGQKYLKTKTDGEHPENLLNLPECPFC